MQRNKFKNVDGFTLIELIIVITIISLLMTIAVPSYINAVERGKENKAILDINVLQNAVIVYYCDHNKYPTELADLENENYIKKVPAPPWDNSYQYENGVVWIEHKDKSIYADGYEKND